MRNFFLTLSGIFGHVPQEVIVVTKTSTGNVLPLVKSESEVLNPAK